MNIQTKLLQVQTDLKAPKGQFNKFGNYKYRNAEDILESVKPLLAKEGLTLTMSDELVLVGERYYVKTTVELFDDKERLQITAYAREEETKKGMDGSQITGASSSYARKYALNGLFLIDDTKDSDATNTHDKEPQKPQEPPKQPEQEYKYIASNQVKALTDLAKQKGSDLATIVEYYGFDDIKKMNFSSYEKAMKALMKKADK